MNKSLSYAVLISFMVLFLIPCISDISDFSAETPGSAVYTFGLTNNAQYTINDTIYQNWNYAAWESYNNFRATTTFPSDAKAEYATGTSAIGSYLEGWNYHHKVVWLRDTSTTAGVVAYNITFTPIQVGTVEFWISPVDYDGVVMFKIGDQEYSEADDNRRVDLYTWGPSTLKMMSSKNGYADVVISYSLNVWYHIRCDFNTYTDTFSLYRDGTLWDSGALNGDSDGISKLIFGAGYGGYLGGVLIDGIDISNAQGYYPRRNQAINTSRSLMNLYYPEFQMSSYSLTSYTLYVPPNQYISQAGITDGTHLIHIIQNLTGILLDVKFSSGSITSLTFTGPENNVNLYSESDQITRWIFDQPNIIFAENFTDWVQNSSLLFDKAESPGMTDSYVSKKFPTWSSGYTMSDVQVYRFDSSADEKWGYIEYPTPSYHARNQSCTLIVPTTINAINAGSYFIISGYNGTIDYTTLSWNTKPADTNITTFYLTGYANSTYYLLEIPISTMQKNIGIKPSNDIFNVQMWSYDVIGYPDPYFLSHNLKLYNSSNYLSVITNKTESIRINKSFSQTLLAGDIIEFTLNNSAQIDTQLSLPYETYSVSGSGINTYRYIVQNGFTGNLSFIINIDQFEEWQLTSLRILRSKSLLNQSVQSYYVAPFSEKQCWVANGSYSVMIYENNALMQIQERNITLFTQNELFFEKTGDIQCRITIFDQRSNVIELSTFHIQIQRTLLGQTSQFWLYSSDFYADYNSNVSIVIYDRFNVQKYSTNLTATNFIDIQLNVYSLKIKNQCVKFNYLNVTRDPNYYPDDTQFWSEWIAPNEIIEYRLFSDYYRVAITNYENSSTQYYAYNFVSDDILLISSENTIANVLTNIQNVNSSLNLQITNVQINLTNQNSQINQSIITLEINLNNVNSSLGDLLLYQSMDITAVGNNITDLYIYQQNQFQLLNNLMNTSFINLNDSIFLMNNSIYTVVNVLGLNLNILNNTIAGNMTTLIQFSPQLTAILTNCLFSENLTWSTDIDAVRAQTELYDIVNLFTNQSVAMDIEYKNYIKTLLIDTAGARDRMMLDYSQFPLNYRVRSTLNNSILQNWTPIVNKTITLGTYQAPLTEENLQAEQNDWLMLVAFLFSIGVVSLYLIWNRSKKLHEKRAKNPLPEPKTFFKIY